MSYPIHPHTNPFTALHRPHDANARNILPKSDDESNTKAQTIPQRRSRVVRGGGCTTTTEGPDPGPDRPDGPGSHRQRPDDETNEDDGGQGGEDGKQVGEDVSSEASEAAGAAFAFVVGLVTKISFFSP